jgi:hypothetical protein
MPLSKEVRSSRAPDSIRMPVEWHLPRVHITHLRRKFDLVPAVPSITITEPGVAHRSGQSVGDREIA